MSNNSQKEVSYMEKKLRVLIAEPDETLCEGLYSLFTREADVVEVSTATTIEDVQVQLGHQVFDLVVVHQSLVTDVTALPQGHFVILIDKPDIHLYWAARVCEARGYFFETAAGSLLRKTLHLPSGVFLIDPAMSAWMLEYFSRHVLLLINVAMLTPREQEVFHLFWQGFHKTEIAEQLGLSTSTVRVHISHIYKKLKLNPNQMKFISLLNNRNDEGKGS